MAPSPDRPSRVHRLLHLATYLQGGAGRAITDLAVAQREAGHDVTVVATRTGVPGFGNYPEYLERLAEAGVRTMLCDSSFSRRRVDNLAVVRDIRAAVDIDRLDLVHAHAATPSSIGFRLAGLTARRLPIVQTMHGWGTAKTVEQASRDLAILKTVARVVVTSAASGDQMAVFGVPRDRLVTIPCGLETVPAAGLPGGAVAAEAFSVRADGTKVLLCLGSVNANKNQRLLVEAMAALAESWPVLCVCVGEGPESASLESLARERGIDRHLRFPGYSSRGAEWLGVADVLVQPSRSEGQGMAVLEAFRARVPVVASAIPAHRELIEHEVTGLLSEVDSVTGLIGALTRVLSMPDRARQSMVTRAHERFAARYTVDRMVAAHERLYADVFAACAHL